MKKRLTALLMAMTMVLAMAACGAKNENDVPASGTMDQVEENLPEAEISTEDETTGEDETQTEDETPVESEDESATQTNKPAETPESKPESEKPAETPEQKPEANAPAQTSVDLNAFYESVLANNPDNWPAMMLTEGEVLDAWFPGLAAVNTKQCYPYTPMMTGQAAEFVLVEAADADAAAAVKEILQARIDYHTSGTAMLYPATEEAWNNNARLVTNGNCVMLIVHSSADDVVAGFNALFA